MQQGRFDLDVFFLELFGFEAGLLSCFLIDFDKEGVVLLSGERDTLGWMR